MSDACSRCGQRPTCAIAGAVILIIVDGAPICGRCMFGNTPAAARPDAPARTGSTAAQAQLELGRAPVATVRAPAPLPAAAPDPNAKPWDRMTAAVRARDAARAANRGGRR